MDQADLEAQAVLQGSERPGLEASWYTLVGAPFLVSVGNGIYALLLSNPPECRGGVGDGNGGSANLGNAIILRVNGSVNPP